jgi:DNA polymerase III epsilon subunit family exonuclease
MSVDQSSPVASVTFAALDFETTGLYPASDRIVEFGAVVFRNGEVVGTFERLANPGIPIGADAAAVSGISDADVAGAPPVEQVVPEFVDFLGDAVLMAHNAPFDLGFLRAAVQELGHGDIENTIIDTQLLAMKAFPKRRSYGLQNLAAELGLPPNRAHRALDDAMMCMRLFQRCVDELSFMGELELAEVLTGRE